MAGQSQPANIPVPQATPEEWLADLFEHNFSYLYIYARARVGPTEAEDVTADCFHAAAIAYRDGRAEQITQAWLLSVAHNKVIDRWRRASTRRSKFHLLQPRPDLTDAFPPALDSQPIREAVLEALDQLTQRRRALLILHHVDGTPTKEIATQLGLSPTAVDSALARARRAFRHHYQPPEGSE